jgi:oligoribonuclease NrnB/cAMP/cGMP phosphodiesterase (DHH superfamily)
MEDNTNIIPSTLDTLEGVRAYLKGLLDLEFPPIPFNTGERIVDTLGGYESEMDDLRKQIVGLTASKDYWYAEHNKRVSKINDIFDIVRQYIEDNDLQEDDLAADLIGLGMEGFSREVDATITVTVTITVRAEDVPTSVTDDDLESELTDAVEQNLSVERYISTYLNGAEVRYVTSVDEVSVDRVDFD